MDPEDLIGTEVVSVYVHHNYITIVFDNGHQVEVSAPSGGSVDDIITECGE